MPSRSGGAGRPSLRQGEQDALEVAKRLIAAMGQPLTVNGGEVFVSFSAGVALSSPGCSAAAILRNADVAMYRAKERGRRVSSSTGLTMTRTSSAGSAPRTSCSAPSSVTSSSCTTSRSSICTARPWWGWKRWCDGDIRPGGCSWPQEFIGLAEDSGLIVAPGAWVLHEACRQVSAWTAQRGGTDQDNARMTVSVNVSPMQLADPGLARRVADALGKSGIDPDQVWLEITERTLMRDADDAAAALEALRDLGPHVQIDDFGTGTRRSVTCSASPSNRSRSIAASYSISSTEPRARRSSRRSSGSVGRWGCR
jgi:diguanylate cyclase